MRTQESQIPNGNNEHDDSKKVIKPFGQPSTDESMELMKSLLLRASIVDFQGCIY